jgi:hypothetical protein
MRGWKAGCVPTISCQFPGTARGGFFESAAAIAEISGRMKNASSAG